MKNRYLSICIVGTLILLSYYVSSCNNEDDAPAPLTDYVAEDEDFENFREWALVAQRKGRAGPDTASLGGGTHQNNRDTVTRYIYIKDDQTKDASGQYPIGTIVVKHYQTDDGNSNGGTAMVKRGENYNPDGGNWEWFNLDNSTPIKIALDGEGNQVRGIRTGCIGCHMAAEVDRDFVFTRP